MHEGGSKKYIDLPLHREREREREREKERESKKRYAWRSLWQFAENCMKIPSYLC